MRSLNRDLQVNQKGATEMKIARLAGLILVAVAALCLGVASTASASAENPLFNFLPGTDIVGTSGTSILYGGGRLVLCLKDVFSGEVSNSLLIGDADVHYLECVSLATPQSATHCAVNSPGASSGLILTHTLHGILGLILPSKRTGILFLPLGNSIFVELEKNACTELTKVTGNVAGELEPIGSLQKTGKTFFTLTPATGFASIKDIDLTHGLGLVKPEIVAFGEPGGLSQTETTESEMAFEIT
jgi:hypothetical protein